MEPVAQISNLSVGRDGVPLLTGLSFTLMPGQALILQAPNGAGKTTLLRTLAGFLPPLEGEILGEDPAFAGHLDGVKAQLTVRENLLFWASVHGGADIGPALDAFDLRALVSRPARALSAGQKRRLGLARLVLTGRRLWLADEPTVSLDKASVTRFADVVRAHLAGGGAALIATHTDLGLEAEILDLSPYRTRRSEGVPAGASRGSGESRDNRPGSAAALGRSVADLAAVAEPGAVVPGAAGDGASGAGAAHQGNGDDPVKLSLPAGSSRGHDTFGADW